MKNDIEDLISQMKYPPVEYNPRLFMVADLHSGGHAVQVIPYVRAFGHEPPYEYLGRFASVDGALAAKNELSRVIRGLNRLVKP